MIRPAIVLGGLLLLAATAALPARAQTCVGDCNGDHMVLVNELIIGVNIALDQQPITACEAFDINGDGKVTINELITAVGNALNGCQAEASPTPTEQPPTPTTTPQGVTRVFTIEPGISMAGPGDTRSAIFTSALGNSNAAVMISPGPLTIVMGAPDENGVAPLSLKEDANVSALIINGQCLCLRFMAADSHGTIDCGAGQTPYDTQAIRGANSPTLEWTATSGLGTGHGVRGNADLLINTFFQLQSVACDAVDCSTVNFTDPANVFAFTTTSAKAIQNQAVGAPATLTDTGEPFDCDHFDQPGQGLLVSPAPTTQLGIDVANAFRFGEAR